MKQVKVKQEEIIVIVEKINKSASFDVFGKNFLVVDSSLWDKLADLINGDDEE